MRVRVRFSKLGKVRWTSHRDLARMWERAFRRVELPLAYTGGFSPRPKVSFGLALPTGAESVAEYLDIELDPSRVDGLDVSALPPRLSAALPAGVDAMATAIIENGAPSLQHEVTSSLWDVTAAVPEVRLRELVDVALAADRLVITRERKGRLTEEDIRPAILSLTVLPTIGPDEAVHLRAELATQPRALRPSELLAAIAPGFTEFGVRRLTQWISRSDGTREEPLPLDALADAPPLERVG